MAQNMNRSMLRHEKGKSADFISERLVAFSLSVTFIILPCILRCAPNSLATAAVSRIERLAVNNLNFLSACKQTCSILCIPSRLWIFFEKNAPDETWRVFFLRRMATIYMALLRIPNCGAEMTSFFLVSRAGERLETRALTTPDNSNGACCEERVSCAMSPKALAVLGAFGSKAVSGVIAATEAGFLFPSSEIGATAEVGFANANSGALHAGLIFACAAYRHSLAKAFIFMRRLAC